jgi:hypothetical protein
MTQTYDHPPIDYASDSTAADAPATTDVAKQQAAAVGNHATEAGQQVATTAKLEAQHVADVASNHAKDLLAQSRSELTAQAQSQQKRAASGLHSLGDELKSMANHSGDQGAATGLADQAGTKVHDVASWLDAREPGHLLEDVKGFASERPVAFLALAAGAGLLAGRLTRGAKDAPSDADAVTNPAARTNFDVNTDSVTSYPESTYGDYAPDATLTGPGL